METSVKAAEVLLPPQPDKASSLDPDNFDCDAAACVSASSSSHTFNPMEEFSRRLEDIIDMHGPAAVLLDKQSVVEAGMEKMEDGKGDLTVVVETDISLIKQSLNNVSSPEEKLEQLVQKYAELAAQRRGDEQRLRRQQQQLSVLLEERRSSAAARSKLESLCRELHAHYDVLREEALQRCREDEEKRKEITSHFQDMLTEIQDQIEQHSARNDKLCRENTNLTDKLESLMTQCERREESLEKINTHRDLQHKLTEAKLQQANALLAEAEDRHKREKEYLLREAIDKTKKCFAMKEQELAMKKKLTLYAQKFDEFQTTLAKSNEIYVRFKKEMDNMTEKMKTLEKESNLWKLRFENCNKALTDMIEERTEKGKEYDLFVLKIQKLEKLCRALQDERKILYEKIKEVRHSNASIPSKGSSFVENSESSDQSALLTTQEIQELEEEDPVLTEDMARLREEQARLQDFATSLFATSDDDEEQEQKSELDLEEDLVASCFVQFKSKIQVKEDLDLAEESDLSQVVKSEEVQNPPDLTPEAPEPEEMSSDTDQTEAHPVMVGLQTSAKVGADEETQQPPEPTPEPERGEPGPESEALKVEVLKEASEETPVLPAEDEKVQLQKPAGPTQVPEESAPPSEDTPQPSASSKKQVPKKKKKSGKSAS
ncbi:beta-taxilin [Xenentodon cancila]